MSVQSQKTKVECIQLLWAVVRMHLLGALGVHSAALGGDLHALGVHLGALGVPPGGVPDPHESGGGLSWATLSWGLGRRGAARIEQ